MEVEENVGDEEPVDQQVDDVERMGRIVKADDERHRDSSVEGQEENYPIPGRLEEVVVEDDPVRRVGNVLLVLRKNVVVEGHELGIRKENQIARQIANSAVHL